MSKEHKKGTMNPWRRMGSLGERWHPEEVTTELRLKRPAQIRHRKEV